MKPLQTEQDMLRQIFYNSSTPKALAATAVAFTNGIDPYRTAPVGYLLENLISAFLFSVSKILVIG